MSEEKPGQYLTIRQDKNPGAFGKWSIPGLEKSFPLDGGDGLILLVVDMQKGIADSELYNYEILDGVLPYVDFFVPSFEELCYMLDRSCYDALAAKGGDMTQQEGIWSAPACLP